MGELPLGGPYEQDPEQLARTWEQVEFERAHLPVLPFIPTTPGLVLDLGAGSGRAAAWFAARGWAVVAVEPAAGLREVARSLHPSDAIRWESDRLPGPSARCGSGWRSIWSG